MIKKIIIFGSSGFIGTKIIKRLKSKNNMKIYGFDKKFSKQNNQNHIKFISGDILNNKKLNKLPKKIDVIIFLVGKLGGPESLKISNAKKYLKINTETLIKVLHIFKFKKIIFISSEHVYNDNFSSKSYNTMEYEPEPKNYYGLSKLVSEKYLYYFYNIIKKRKLSVDIIRTPRVIDKEKNNLIQKIIRKLLRKEKIYIFKRSKFNFLDIDDLISAIMKCLNTNKNKYRIFDIFNNSPPISLEDLIKIVSKKKQIKPVFSYKKKETYDHNPKNLKIKNLYAKKELNWFPKKETRDIVEDLILNEFE